MNLSEAKKSGIRWSGDSSGIYADLKNGPDKPIYYCRCPRCRDIHGAYKTYSEAFYKRLCPLCRAHEAEDLLKDVDKALQPEKRKLLAWKTTIESSASRLVSALLEADPEHFNPKKFALKRFGQARHFGAEISIGHIPELDHRIEELGLPNTVGWEAIRRDRRNIEATVIRLLRQRRISVRTRGVDNFGDLIVEILVRTDSPGWPVIHAALRNGHSLSTADGSFSVLDADGEIYKAMSELSQRVVDVSLNLIDAETIAKFHLYPYQTEES